MDRWKTETGRIAERERRPHAGDEALDGEEPEESTPDERRNVPRNRRESVEASRAETRESSGHQRRVSDHAGTRHVVAPDAARMLGHHVESSVTDSVLLREIATRLL